MKKVSVPKTFTYNTMNFDERMFEKYPNLFEKNEKGEPYVPCGLYCPTGWQPIVEELFGCIDSYIKNTHPMKKNPKVKLFYKVYRTIWVPVYKQLKRFFDPYKGITPSSWNGSWKSYSRERQDEAKLTSNYRITKKLQDFDWSLRKTRPEYIDDDPIPQLVIDQVKEKFGGLRVYTSGGDKATSGMISFATWLADQTCEETGEKGTLYKKGGWYKTLSPEKAKELEYKEIP